MRESFGVGLSAVVVVAPGTNAAAWAENLNDEGEDEDEGEDMMVMRLS